MHFIAGGPDKKGPHVVASVFLIPIGLRGLATYSAHRGGGHANRIFPLGGDGKRRTTPF